MQRKNFLTLTLWFLVLISLYSCKKNSTSPRPLDININEDIDGNYYDTIRIGNQLWMVQPLKVTRFNDGTVIPHLSKGSDWANAVTNPARCYYGTNVGDVDVSNSDSAKYAATYGALYNWYAVNHKGADGKANLAPKGWHVADTADWNTLIGTLSNTPNFTGGSHPTLGGMLKETGTSHWQAPNTGVTNSSSGFKALPGGYRSSNGNFYSLGYLAAFWSSTESSSDSAYYQDLYYVTAKVGRNVDGKLLGFTVICVRD